MYSVSARQIQREYKKLLEEANRIMEPIVVISNNQPKGAIIGLKLLEKVQMNIALKEALDEYRKGKTLTIKSKKDLDTYLKEIEDF